MAINWQLTAANTRNAAQNATPGEAAIGAPLLAAIVAPPWGLTGAGPTYDALGNDGNGAQGIRTPYQINFQYWWSSPASPVWTDLDRISRYAFSLAFASSGRGPLITPTLTTFAAAVFGLQSAISAIPWAPSANFGLGFVSPTPINGLYYQGGAIGSTTGGSQPVWPTILGATVSDGTQTWTCTTPIFGTSPTVLAPDASLQLQVALNARYSAATSIAQQLGQSGLTAMLVSANSQWTAALAARPMPNPAPDAISTAAINALTLSLANANAWLASLSFQ